MRVGIVGCGLIGRKRAAALGGATLTACADPVLERARALAGPAGARACENWREVVASPEVDLVVVATPHDGLAEVSLAALRHGKHVLVEKPAARTVAELAPVAAEAERSGLRVHVGFNHRYHRALRKAAEIVAQGTLGPLFHVRGRYGHGGRPGMEKEWRSDPRRSGGGELIDQGVHLVDLARWFLGDFVRVRGLTRTFFWPQPVEDNAFLLLETAGGQVAWLHAGTTEWKNLFSLELTGRDARLQVDGLGGSYGTERLTLHRMLPGMGPPETTIWEYPMADDSWAVEFAEFLDDIRLGRQPASGLPDAAAALHVVHLVYEEARGAHHT